MSTLEQSLSQSRFDRTHAAGCFKVGGTTRNYQVFSTQANSVEIPSVVIRPFHCAEQFVFAQERISFDVTFEIEPSVVLAHFSQLLKPLQFDRP